MTGEPRTRPARPTRWHRGTRWLVLAAMVAHACAGERRILPAPGASHGNLARPAPSTVAGAAPLSDDVPRLDASAPNSPDDDSRLDADTPPSPEASRLDTDTAPSPDEASRPDADPGCPEVSCVVEPDGPCCPYRRPARTQPERTLERASIAAAISAIRPRVMACGDRSQAKGAVRVRVDVGSDGRVAGVNVLDPPDVALGECVVRVVWTMRFEQPGTGGSFSYRFIF